METLIDGTPKLLSDTAELVNIKSQVYRLNQLLMRNEGRGLTPTIKSDLDALDLSSLDDFYLLSASLQSLMVKRRINPITPPSYPTLDKFANQMEQVINGTGKRLPPMPKSIRASEIAKYGSAWTGWQNLQGRQLLSLEGYNFTLGKLLCDEIIYPEIALEDGNIEVSQNWKIENGRRRGLILRTLGSEYVSDLGLDHFVKIDKI